MHLAQTAAKARSFEGHRKEIDIVNEALINFQKNVQANLHTTKIIETGGSDSPHLKQINQQIIDLSHELNVKGLDGFLNLK